MLFKRSTRAIVTGKRPRETGYPGQESEVMDMEENEAAQALPFWRKHGDWLGLAVCTLILVQFIALAFLYAARESRQETAIPQGKAVVAVAADEPLALQAQPGDVVQLYGADAAVIPALRYVQVYGAREGGLLVLLTEEQMGVFLAQERVTVSLVVHKDPDMAGELLALQERICDPEISLSVPDTASLAPGETLELEFSAQIEPQEAVLPGIVWETSDPAVATVENGIVTAQGVGEAAVSVNCGGEEASCNVSVAIPLEAISLDKPELRLAAGEEAVLSATAEPADATGFAVAWSTADPAVATVGEDGKVTAKGVGETVVTASCGGVETSCKVIVGVHAEVAQLDKATLSLTVGQAETLAAAVYPGSDILDAQVWETSDPAVATVSEDGTVTGVKAGTATIIFRCGQATASCTVTVK